MTATMFSYEALDSAGVMQKGTVQAETAEAAAGSLGAQKLVPLTIEPAGKGLRRELTLPTFRGRTTLKDLAIMSRQFASMTAAGLTLLRSLSILEEQTDEAEAARRDRGASRPTSRTAPPFPTRWPNTPSTSRC